MSDRGQPAPGAGGHAGEANGVPFRVGLLGHGTVGSGFATLLAGRAGEIERFNGRRPVISGILTRSLGDFSEILEGAGGRITDWAGGLVAATPVSSRSFGANP